MILIGFVSVPEDVIENSNAANGDAESAEDAEVRFVVRLRGLPYSAKESHISEFLKPARISSLPNSILLTRDPQVDSWTLAIFCSSHFLTLTIALCRDAQAVKRLFVLRLRKRRSKLSSTTGRIWASDTLKYSYLMRERSCVPLTVNPPNIISFIARVAVFHFHLKTGTHRLVNDIATMFVLCD